MRSYKTTGNFATLTLDNKNAGVPRKWNTVYILQPFSLEELLKQDDRPQPLHLTNSADARASLTRAAKNPISFHYNCNLS